MAVTKKTNRSGTGRVMVILGPWLRRVSRFPFAATLLLLAVAGFSACRGHTRTPHPETLGRRNWWEHPAVAVVDQAPSTMLAISDVHGAYQRMLALLARNHVIEPGLPAPEAIRWSAGNATFIFIGDLIDKGPSSIEVLDAARTLQPQAEAAGGRVIVTMGNHEAEFLADPENGKATRPNGLASALEQQGLKPKNVAAGSDPRGFWLRNLPLAAKIGGWFFVHAGNTKGRSVHGLEQVLRAAVDAKGYDAEEIIGTESLIEARGWYSEPEAARRDAKALGVAHIVFGHDPNALGSAGEIAVAQGGLLFRIDCGISPEVGYSTGKLLRIRTDGSREIAESLDAEGNVEPLWQSP